MKKILITGGSIVNDDGVTKADVLIGVTGEIEQIAPKIQKVKDADVIDATGHLLFPLLIDCHVHFREPGLEHKATMQTESTAALAGGVGTVCEMPNTIPPTVTVAALADKIRRAAHVDGMTLKFFFGITEALHLAALHDLWSSDSMELKRLKHHCAGVKLFLDNSTGDQKVDGGIVDDIFKTCADLKIPLVAHCEDSEMNAAAKAKNTRTDISAHSAMRPPESEAKSIADAIEFVKKHGTHFHVAHLSTKLGLDVVRKAKAAGLPVTCEVAPHHLFLSTDDYVTLGSLGKMNPPLRTKEDRDALWFGIADGTVDCISTDHAPHTLEEKRVGDPLSAPSGVPGVETMVPLLLSCVAGVWPHPKGKLPTPLTASVIHRLCFTNPNNIFALGQHPIVEKAKARIVIVDPDAEWTIEAKNLHSKCGWTPFEGWTVRGWVERVVQ